MRQMQTFCTLYELHTCLMYMRSKAAYHYMCKIMRIRWKFLQRINHFLCVIIVVSQTYITTICSFYHLELRSTLMPRSERNRSLLPRTIYMPKSKHIFQIPSIIFLTFSCLVLLLYRTYANHKM